MDVEKEMKTYTQTMRNLDGNRWLVDDGGNPPTLGETVLVAGRLAEVVADNGTVINDSESGGRFIITFIP